MAVAIVGGAFLGVAQDTIGFGVFLKFLFRFMIAGVAVGMKFERQPAVRRFERRFIAIAADAENFVIVAFDHAQVLIPSPLYLEPGSTATLTMAGRSRRP